MAWHAGVRVASKQLLPCLAAQTPPLDTFHFACSASVVAMQAFWVVAPREGITPLAYRLRSADIECGFASWR